MWVTLFGIVIDSSEVVPPNVDPSIEVTPLGRVIDVSAIAS
jgi:hypothetical protein